MYYIIYPYNSMEFDYYKVDWVQKEEKHLQKQYSIF